MSEIEKIPGVGKKMAEALKLIGINTVADLKDRDPEALYIRLCAAKGQNVDRCVLYVFRCAVYYASEKIHEPGKLKWWYWKD